MIEKPAGRSMYWSLHADVVRARPTTNVGLIEVDGGGDHAVQRGRKFILQVVTVGFVTIRVLRPPRLEGTSP